MGQYEILNQEARIQENRRRTRDLVMYISIAINVLLAISLALEAL